jgi:hypothetical protein
MRISLLRLWNITKVGLMAISRNKMRSLLTMLGIIIGVACVITMVAVGTGASSSIQATINSLGTNFIMLFPGAATTGGARMFTDQSKITPEDADAIKAECPAVSYVSPRRPHQRADRRRRAQLGDPGVGRRRRLAVHPRLERRRWRLLHRRRRAHLRAGLRPRRHGGREPLPGGRRGGLLDPHQEPPFPGGGRARTQGGQHDGAGPGRPDHRPLHDGDEAAPGLAADQHDLHLRPLRRRGAGGADPDRRADAPAPPHRARPGERHQHALAGGDRLDLGADLEDALDPARLGRRHLAAGGGGSAS